MPMKTVNRRRKIKTITLPLPLRVGSVNCYLIEADPGYILIDTGGSNSRRRLMGELEAAGCKPGSLELIVLTHGDFDHAGNARSLRRTFGSKIAMHHHDVGMVARGDMFANRKRPNIIIRALMPRLSGFGPAERFRPDILVWDGDELLPYGFDARAISIPGHSKGSIGILTARADLFCGDLWTNLDEPTLNSLLDDLPAANASVAKLMMMKIGTIYPGHGLPFPMHAVAG